MNEVPRKPQTLIDKARAEVEEEFEKKAIAQLKKKLKELITAETVVANLKREIEDLEQSIKQGNLTDEG